MRGMGGGMVGLSPNCTAGYRTPPGDGGVPKEARDFTGRMITCGFIIDFKNNRIITNDASIPKFLQILKSIMNELSGKYSSYTKQLFKQLCSVLNGLISIEYTYDIDDELDDEEITIKIRGFNEKSRFEVEFTCFHTEPWFISKFELDINGKVVSNKDHEIIIHWSEVEYGIKMFLAQIVSKIEHILRNGVIEEWH